MCPACEILEVPHRGAAHRGRRSTYRPPQTPVRTRLRIRWDNVAAVAWLTVLVVGATLAALVMGSAS